MSFSRHRIKYINLEELEQVLKEVKVKCNHIYFRAKQNKNIENFGFSCFIEDGKTELKISYCRGLRPCTYIFKKDCADPKHYVTGLECWRVFNRYAKAQTIQNDVPKGLIPYDKEEGLYRVGSAKALLYKNPKYAGKRVTAYSYDLNSAYAMMLKKPIPDIRTLKRNAKIGKNQIGFIERAEGELTISFEIGKRCHYVCDLMESPYQKFVDVWYDRKRNAKNKREKSIAKDYLNFPVGFTQSQTRNPFLRACIVGRCNLYIKSLMDENTIYSNTDCIVSTVRRPDLEENLGLDVGQWKLEHAGEEFAWADTTINYQWNLEVPAYRGIPKQWFKTFEIINGRPWDILSDTAPTFGNLYKFNKETLDIEEIEYAQE